MDPKEYAARLQRMQDEIEVAKAREQISNGYNKAMETSPMVDTAERLYAEFKAAKKPAKKPAKKVDPARAKPEPDMGTPEGVREYAKSIGYKGKYASLAPRAPYDPSDSDMTVEDWQDYEALAQRSRIPHYMRQGEFKPVDRPIRRAMGVLPAAVAEGKAKLAPTVNAVKDTVKPAKTVKPAPVAKPVPAAQPRTSDRPPDEALMEIERMSPEEAMAEWSQIASSTGVTGKKSPRDAAILEALRKKKSLYDDSKVKQAPAAPYVPSWMGVRK